MIFDMQTNIKTLPKKPAEHIITYYYIHIITIIIVHYALAINIIIIEVQNHWRQANQSMQVIIAPGIKSYRYLASATGLVKRKR